MVGLTWLNTRQRRLFFQGRFRKQKQPRIARAVVVNRVAALSLLRRILGSTRSDAAITSHSNTVGLLQGLPHGKIVNSSPALRPKTFGKYNSCPLVGITW